MLSRQIINITVVAEYFHSKLFDLRNALLMDVTLVVEIYLNIKLQIDFYTNVS